MIAPVVPVILGIAAELAFCSALSMVPGRSLRKILFDTSLTFYSNSVDLQNDPNNCGSCGNVCPSQSRCTSGVCACIPALDNCGTASDLIWCVCFSFNGALRSRALTGTSNSKNTQADPDNCGTCGNICGPGLKCAGGKCSP